MSRCFLLIIFPACLLQQLVISKNPVSHHTDFVRISNGFEYTSYQKGIICNSIYKPVTPTSLNDLQLIVQNALLQNITVKPIGHLYSITDIICTDGVPIHMNKINHFSYDHTTGLATIGAGATLEFLTEKLHGVDRALEGMPALSFVTVGGAIATSAHGSSLKRRTTISSQIVALTFIDGHGAIRNITQESHRKMFNAFKNHLGLLGILYQVALKTVSQYKVHTTNEIFPDKHIFKNVSEFIEKDGKSSDFFQFFWFPTFEQVVVSKSEVVPLSTPGQCEIHLIPEVSRAEAFFFKFIIEFMQKYSIDFGLYLLQLFNLKSLVRPVFGKTPLFLEEGSIKSGKQTQFCSPSVGFSHKMLANKCEECAWNQGEDSVLFEESEIFIPLSELPAALETMRSILAFHPVQFYLLGILFRFIVQPDDDDDDDSDGAILACEGHQKCVGIEWIHGARLNRFTDAKIGMAGIQALTQALVQKHGGKAHWGKNGLHYSTPHMIQYQHGEKKVKKFVEHMEKLDPNGVFLNDFGQRVRFGREKMTLRNETRKHCALLDHCVCKTDEDCGDEESNLFCSEIGGLSNDFRVCDRKHNLMLMIFREVNAFLISVLKTVGKQNEVFIMTGLLGVVFVVFVQHKILMRRFSLIYLRKL